MRRALVGLLLLGISGVARAQDATTGLPLGSTYINGTAQPNAKIVALTATTVTGGTFTGSYASVGCTTTPILEASSVSGVLTLLGSSTASIASETTTTVTGTVSVTSALGVLSLSGAGITVNILGACY